jgi:hypothetical protein
VGDRRGTEDNEEFMKSSMNDLRGDVSKIHSIENTTIAGKPAYKVDFTYVDDPDNLEPELNRANSYFILDDEKETYYLIINKVLESKYTQFQPIIQKIVNSFRIE